MLTNLNASAQFSNALRVFLLLLVCIFLLYQMLSVLDIILYYGSLALLSQEVICIISYSLVLMRVVSLLVTDFRRFLTDPNINLGLI